MSNLSLQLSGKVVFFCLFVCLFVLVRADAPHLGSETAARWKLRLWHLKNCRYDCVRLRLQKDKTKSSRLLASAYRAPIKKKKCWVYEFIHTLQHFLSVSLKSFSLSCTYWLKIDAKHLRRPLLLRSFAALLQISTLLLPTDANHGSARRSISNYEPVLLVICVNFHSLLVWFWVW